MILTLLSANNARFFTYAGFEINKEYISSKLCENRNRPWLHCNGKCYLMKKIKQAEEKQSKEERETQKSLFQEAFCPSDKKVHFYTNLLQVMPVPRVCSTMQQTGVIILQPPQFYFA